MKRKGFVLIISAPSGAGKTSLCHELLKRFPDMRESVSYTTRKPRAGEINGEDYFFVSHTEFQQMVADNAFAEWAEVHGNLYGTALETLENAIKNGTDIILDIDCQGAKTLKNRLAAGLFVFILPPSMSELRQRLDSRSSDAADVIERRIKCAADEIRECCWYDYIIINDKFEEAAVELTAIVLTQRRRTSRMLGEVAKLFDVCDEIV